MFFNLIGTFEGSFTASWGAVGSAEGLEAVFHCRLPSLLFIEESSFPLDGAFALVFAAGLEVALSCALALDLLVELALDLGFELDLDLGLGLGLGLGFVVRCLSVCSESLSSLDESAVDAPTGFEN